MEGISLQNILPSDSSSLCQSSNMEKTGDVVLDIDSLVQHPDKCTGSPKLKALSRKASNRLERRNSRDQETDEATRKIIFKVATSQMEQLKQSLASNKAHTAQPAAANGPSPLDAGDGRMRKLNRFTSFNPRRILLLFASMSVFGTMILIYFTLAIYWRGATQASLEGLADE